MEEVYMTQEEFENSIEVGDVIETDKGEKLRCVSKENGEPQFKLIESELEITELQSIIATMQAQLTSLINGGQ